MGSITVSGTPGANQVYQQPASGTPGSAIPYIRPFGNIYFYDPYSLVSATIQVLNPVGTPSDADGVLQSVTGITGFSHTGAGTYTYTASGNSYDQYYTIYSNLQQLEFVPTPVSNAPRPDTIVLTLSDQAGDTFVLNGSPSSPASPLQTTITTEPPPAAQVPPVVAGTSSTPLDVVAPNAINPFKGVTITDGNANPKDVATITLTGAGVGNNTLATNNATSGLPGLSQVSPGVYQIAAGTPADVTTVLDNLVFSSAFMAAGNVVGFQLTVTNANNNQTTTNADTKILDVPQPSVSAPVSSVTITNVGTVGVPVPGPGVLNGPNNVTVQGSHTGYVVALDPSTGNAEIQSTAANGATQTAVGLHDVDFSDGIGKFDPTGNAEEVARLYKAAFNRAADNAGLDGWTTQLDDHTIGLSQVAAAFVGSAEFNTDYGKLDNTGFVTRLYQNVLGRAPDAAGLQSWVNALNAGASRQTVLLGFSDSIENKTDTEATIGDKDMGEAYRLYRAALHRAPDPAGLAGWTSQLDSGVSEAQVAQGFVNSAEFQSIFTSPDNTGFVTQLYQNVLGRAPDPAGLQSWLADLNGGASRANVLIGFSDSLENRLLTASATHDNWVFLPKAS
jgi:hypothetical protein